MLGKCTDTSAEFDEKVAAIHTHWATAWGLQAPANGAP
jgi:hypothetical protein